MICRSMSTNVQRININSIYSSRPSPKITLSNPPSMSASTDDNQPADPERKMTPSEALNAGRFAIGDENGRGRLLGSIPSGTGRDAGLRISTNHSTHTRSQTPSTPSSHLPRPRAIPSYSSSRARSAMTPPRTFTHIQENVLVSEDEIEILSPPPTPARKSRMATIFVKDSSSSQGSTSTSSGISSQSSFAIDDTSPLPPRRPTMKIVHPSIASSARKMNQTNIRSFTTSTNVSSSTTRVNLYQGSNMPDVPDGLLDDLNALSLAEEVASQGDAGYQAMGQTLTGRNVEEPASQPSAIAPPSKTIHPTTLPISSSTIMATKSTLPLFSINTFSSPHTTHSRPTIVYTSSSQEANELLSCLRGGIYGFDLEWPVWRGENAPKNGRSRKWMKPGKVALVQVCDEKMVLLLHLSKMDVFPKKLREFCEDPSIIKLGVQVRGDGQKLSRDFDDLLPNGLLDLSHLARRVDPLGCGPGNQLISLANLSKAYLGRDLDKGDVRMSDWSRNLDKKQIDYAANDVYASYLIYKRLVGIAEDRGQPLDDLHSAASHLRQEHSQYNDIIRQRPSSQEDEDDSPSPVRVAAVPSTSIRAFVLFSMGKDVDEIGKAMRTADNPLAKSTVKSYIVDAVTRDITLGYDKRRMYALLNDGSFLSRFGEKLRRRLALELCEEPPATLSDDVNSGRE